MPKSDSQKKRMDFCGTGRKNLRVQTPEAEQTVNSVKTTEDQRLFLSMIHKVFSGSKHHKIYNLLHLQSCLVCLTCKKN